MQQFRVIRNNDNGDFESVIMESEVFPGNSRWDHDFSEAEFNELMLLSKCHSRRYPVIKKWFLDRFEEVKMYGFDKIETSGKVVEALSFEDIA